MGIDHQQVLAHCKASGQKTFYPSVCEKYVIPRRRDQDERAVCVKFSVRATGTTKILYMITGEGPMSEAVLGALRQFLTEKLIL
jgi:hypothetical protein